MDDPRVQLAPRHSLVLRLKELGADDGLIAECLGIDVAAVEPLVTVAEAKLAEVTAAGEATTEQARSGSSTTDQHRTEGTS